LAGFPKAGFFGGGDREQSQTGTTGQLGDDVVNHVDHEYPQGENYARECQRRVQAVARIDEITPGTISAENHQRLENIQHWILWLSVVQVRHSNFASHSTDYQQQQEDNPKWHTGTGKSSYLATP